MEAILTFGVYSIGNSSVDVLRVVTDAVKVEITKDKWGQDPPDSYTNKVFYLNELRDLESRLVLIGGNYHKGREEVEKFLEVM